jgi:hypothetical protein
LSSFDKKGGGLMNKGYKGKRAQGLSLNMIVVGAIGLVVLVVIITIFTSGMIGIQEDLKDKTCCSPKGGCEDKNIGGEVVTGSSCPDTVPNLVIGDFPDVSAAGGQICCVK